MAVFVQSSSFRPSQVPLEYFHLLSLSVVTSHKAHLHQIQLLTRTVSPILKLFCSSEYLLQFSEFATFASHPEDVCKAAFLGSDSKFVFVFGEDQ